MFNEIVSIELANVSGGAGRGSNDAPTTVGTADNNIFSAFATDLRELLGAKSDRPVSSAVVCNQHGRMAPTCE